MVDAEKCNLCMACISPCPTGSIDNWRTMPLVRAYSIEEQLTWESLPAELSPEELAAAGADAGEADAPAAAPVAVATAEPGVQPQPPLHRGATVPPWSAAHAYTNLYPPKSPTTATVVGNFNCTEAGFESETHHVVLDFGSMPFPVLEGQSIGIVPPGTCLLYTSPSPRD